MFEPKCLDVGFVIICPESNSGHLRHTIKSIRFRYGDAPCIAVVPHGISKEEIEEMKKFCPVYRGKKTITSLINTGLRNASGWSLLVMAGSWLQGKEIQKFSCFVEKETDILYPIVDGVYDWVDATLNGILIHTNAIKSVGPFGDDNPLPVCKLLWSLDAIQQGYRFKAVLGSKIL